MLLQSLSLLPHGVTTNGRVVYEAGWDASGDRHTGRMLHMNYLRACLDPRVVGVVALAGLAVVLLAPGLVAAAIPLLLVAACPLSMLVMMRTMGGHAASGPASGGDRVTDLRRELADLTERKRVVESELGATGQTARRDPVRAMEAAPAEDR